MTSFALERPQAIRTMTDPIAQSSAQSSGTEAPLAAPPRPTFDAMPLGAEVRKALDEMGYLHPTPVQLAVYDPIARGKDVKVQARTGTGKTTAFGLPIVDQLVRKSGGLQVLCLCPTRELALQVAAEIQKLGKHKGVKVCAVYGGAPMGRQIAELEDGAQVVVGTPGRVLDHLRRGTMDAKGIRGFVLDEADEMLSMGFEKELNSIVEKLPKSKQTMLFSATLSNDVGRLVRQMNDPEAIMLSGDQVGALELVHYFYLNRGDKTRDLLRLLEVEDPTSAILFCNTKDETERVARELRKAGFAADYLSGDLDQREREKVMTATREGKVRYLVATDVAARGIDISHVTHVINVDFPDSAEQYVHRTGRTGRAGRTGTAVSLLSAKDIGNLYYLRLTYGLRPIERVLPTEEELRARRETDLIEQIAQKAKARTTDADARAIARRLLTHDDAVGLVASLVRESLGSQLVAEEEAGKARRARNPPALTDPPPTTKSESPKSKREAPQAQSTHEAVAVATTVVVEQSAAISPAVLAQPERAARPAGPRPPRGNAEGPPRRERDARRERVPHSQFVEWAPPQEADDETPIFTKEKREAAELARNEERAAAPRAEERPARPERTERVERVERVERAERTERTEEEAAPAFETRTLFVNVGRRDGARASELVRLVAERSGLPGDIVGRVRVRDRNTFLDIKTDVAEKVMEALKGASIGGRTVNAELARPREEGAPVIGEDESTLPMGGRR